MYLLSAFRSLVNVLRLPTFYLSPINLAFPMPSPSSDGKNDFDLNLDRYLGTTEATFVHFRRSLGSLNKILLKAPFELYYLSADYIQI